MKYFIIISALFASLLRVIPHQEAPKTAGFSNIWDYGATGGIMIGNQESVELLNDYIEKHNTRDYEGIRAMNI